MPNVPALRIDAAGVRRLNSLGYRPSVGLIQQIIADPVKAVAVAIYATNSAWDHRTLRNAGDVSLALARALAGFLPPGPAAVVRSRIELLAAARASAAAAQAAEAAVLADLASMAQAEASASN